MDTDPNGPARPVAAPPDFSSRASASLTPLLNALGVSVAITTYQAGKLILVRPEGDVLNTHFRDFLSPMGITYKDGVLAIGDRLSIWKFRNMASMGAQPKEGPPHDAVFLPASRIFTGDIRIHEIGFWQDRLWAVNTRFSCLCTFDGHHNFVPGWKPPFVTSYSAEDRCHLNGFCIAENGPAIASCHAMTDHAQGWRNHKTDGGALIEIATGRALVEGICMPHSPRLYNGKLWYLESGRGMVRSVDLQSGANQVEFELPGFTRGLDFHGRYAFVGLSQVRETSDFGGIPISEPGRERKCGLWVLDILERKTVALLEFSGSVQEIFAIAVLPFRRPDVVLNQEDWLSNSFFIQPDMLPQFSAAPAAASARAPEAF